jgi:hypothetical protein
MKMRHVAAGLAVVTVLAGGTAAALAGPPHHGGWRGGPPPCGGAFPGWYPGNAADPAQQAAVEELFRKHGLAVEPLRQQLYAKHLELDALKDNPNAKPEIVAKLAQEIAQLDGELRKAGRDFREELRKDPNITLPPGGMEPYPGYGRMPGPRGGWCR